MNTTAIVIITLFAMVAIAYMYYSKRHRQTPKKKGGVSRPGGGTGGSTPE
jgi:uncharacterized membrane protein